MPKSFGNNGNTCALASECGDLTLCHVIWLSLASVNKFVTIAGFNKVIQCPFLSIALEKVSVFIYTNYTRTEMQQLRNTFLFPWIEWTQLQVWKHPWSCCRSWALAVPSTVFRALLLATAVICSIECLTKVEPLIIKVQPSQMPKSSNLQFGEKVCWNIFIQCKHPIP